MADEATKTVDNPFTPGEMTLLLAIMQNLTSDIQFDADAIAQKLGYKDGGIVKVRWGQIKRKKINVGGGEGGAAVAAASPSGIKKRTPKKKGKAAAAADGESGEAEDDVETPVKTRAKRERKPKVKKEEAGEGAAEGEEEGNGEQGVKAEVDEF